MLAKQFDVTTTEYWSEIFRQINAFKPPGRLRLLPVLLLLYWLINSPLFVGVLCWSLFLYALLCVLSSFAIILKRKRELVAVLFLSDGCFVPVKYLWSFLACLGVVGSM